MLTVNAKDVSSTPPLLKASRGEKCMNTIGINDEFRKYLSALFNDGSDTGELFLLISYVRVFTKNNNQLTVLKFGDITTKDGPLRQYVLPSKTTILSVPRALHCQPFTFPVARTAERDSMQSRSYMLRHKLATVISTRHLGRKPNNNILDCALPFVAKDLQIRGLHLPSISGSIKSRSCSWQLYSKSQLLNNARGARPFSNLGNTNTTTFVPSKSL